MKCRPLNIYKGCGLSLETQEIGEAIVPAVEPVVERSVRRVVLVQVRLDRHVLLASYAEIALYRTPTHRAAVQLVEAARTNTGVPGKHVAREEIQENKENVGCGMMFLRQPHIYTDFTRLCVSTSVFCQNGEIINISVSIHAIMFTMLKKNKIDASICTDTHPGHPL